MSSAKPKIKYIIIRNNYERNIYPDTPSLYGNHTQELYLGIIENKAKVIKSKLFENYEAGAVSLDLVGRKRPVDEDDGSSKKIKFNFEENSAQRLNELENKIENSNDESLQKPISYSDLKQRYVEIDNKINEEKRKILAKFGMLSAMYPSTPMPYITMSTDLEFMKNEYETIFRKLKIHDKQLQYKQFLIFAFYGIEYVLGRFCKMNMDGFSKSQIANINQYDRLLIELGHKHYVSDAPESFPVEIRLVGMILIQTAIFVIMQKVTSSINNSSFGNLSNLLGSFMGGGNRQPTMYEPQYEQPKMEKQESKMQGPKVYEKPKPTPILVKNEKNKEDEGKKDEKEITI
jgi:hypothetical protein